MWVPAKFVPELKAQRTHCMLPVAQQSCSAQIFIVMFPDITLQQAFYFIFAFR